MHFAAKRIAICSKTHCNMQQNTLRLAAKHSAKCCKTRDKMQQNTQKTIKNGVLSAIYRQIDHFKQETTC